MVRKCHSSKRKVRKDSAMKFQKKATAIGAIYEKCEQEQ